MDVIFRKGSYNNFNTTEFPEGSVCFVNYSESNDYIYRIGEEGNKIGIMGDGYLINDSEFKILKNTLNCNDKIKIGEMIQFTITDDDGADIIWNIPSIKGCGSSRNNIEYGRHFILDIEADDGSIIPNPNKKIALGQKHAPWNGLWLSNEIICKKQLLISTVDSEDIVLNPASGQVLVRDNISCGISYSLQIDNTDVIVLNHGMKTETINGKEINKNVIYLGSNTDSYKSIIFQAGDYPLEFYSETFEMNDKTYSQVTLSTDERLFCLDSAAYICPSPKKTTGTIHLGAPSLRWKNIYFAGTSSGTVSEVTQAYVDGDGTTSDKRLKEIQSNEILQKDLLLYDTLVPVCYKYKNILPDHSYSRTHIGFLAQDIENQIKNFELSSEECALVQARPLNEDDPQELKDICTDGYKYYLNYNELHGLHTLKNHQQDARLTALEEKNQELENTVSELKTQIELFKLAIGG